MNSVISSGRLRSSTGMPTRTDSDSSVATAMMWGSAAASSGWPRLGRWISIFGIGADLEALDDHEIERVRCSFSSRSVRVGSLGASFSTTSAHRWSEPTSTCEAPALRSS